MTVDESKPSIAERYGVATTTSNLRIGDKRTEGDLVLAAAMQPHYLGALLLRLQTEFDGQKAELEHAAENARRLELEAKRIERSKDPLVDVVSEAAAVRRRSEGEVITARYLILAKLKTLREAKTAVGAYALVLATRQRFLKPDEHVLRLSGRVLDVHLDPTCATCDGTGSVGSGYEGKTPKICPTCGGSAHRRDQVGNSHDDRWFAFLLLGDLQREMADAAAAMARLMRNET